MWAFEFVDHPIFWSLLSLSLGAMSRVFMVLVPLVCTCIPLLLHVLLNLPLVPVCMELLWRCPWCCCCWIHCCCCYWVCCPWNLVHCWCCVCDQIFVVVCWVSMLGSGKLVRPSLCVLIPCVVFLVSRHYFCPVCQCVENTVFSPNEVVAIPM